MSIKEVEFLINEIEPKNPLLFPTLYNQFQSKFNSPLYSYDIKFRDLLFTLIDLEDDTNDEPENILLTIAYQGITDIELFNNLLKKIGSRPVLIYKLNKKEKKTLLKMLEEAADINMRKVLVPNNELSNIINDIDLYINNKLQNIEFN